MAFINSILDVHRSRPRDAGTTARKARFGPTALCSAIVCLSSSGPAMAQRVNENTVAEAQDAFGINISGQNLGLYNPSSARGFSPSAAGNIRLEGLYFDQQGTFTSRLVSGARILVGPSVLGHPFPAPSGIAEYRLRKPGGRDILSLSTQIDSFSAGLIEMDGQLGQILPGLGVAGGVGLYHYDFWYGGTANTLSTALTAKWTPADHVSVIPFWSRSRNGANEAQPTILFDGRTLPPKVDPRRFTGQHWAKGRETDFNYGILTKADLGGWQVGAGLFRSTFFSPISYTPLFLHTQPDGAAGRTMLAERGQRSAATSGELEISRHFSEGPRKHALHFAIWGRDQLRHFGASGSADLGPGNIEQADFTQPPVFTFATPSRDHVRQITLGLAYEGSWAGVGLINLSIEKSRYRKLVVMPIGPAPESSDAPWLFNGSIAVPLTHRLTAYGGLSHGLEESDVAPAIAVNRDEAPPAIHTRQVDAGAKWQIGGKLTLVGSIFRIEKPYFGLDAARVFRRLGEIRHDGVELSLAGSPVPGLSIVAGALLLDASVSGAQRDSGEVGPHPVGSSPAKIIGSVDYRPPGSPLSFDVNLSHEAHRVASVDGTVTLPERDMLDLGLRYRFPIAGKPCVFRLQAANIFNAFSWEIAGSKALQVSAPRQILARVTVDL